MIAKYGTIYTGKIVIYFLLWKTYLHLVEKEQSLNLWHNLSVFLFLLWPYVIPMLDTLKAWWILTVMSVQYTDASLLDEHNCHICVNLLLLFLYSHKMSLASFSGMIPQNSSHKGTSICWTNLDKAMLGYKAITQSGLNTIHNYITSFLK